MGSGLILAGIGKGISDAGATYGNAMSKAAELEWKQQEEDRSYERKLRMADQLETQKEERNAAKATEIAKRADEAPLRRDVDALYGKASQVQGDSPVMGKEEMLKMIRENPEYREVYRKAGLIGEDKMDPRMRRAMDEESAAREVGASATMLESYRRAKADTLAVIKEENRDAQRKAEFDALLPIRQQNADAATTRANRPTGSGGKTDTGDKPPTGIDLERNAKAAKQALALELGVTDKDVAEKVAQLKKKGGITPSIQEKLDSYNGALANWQNYKSNKPSANRSSDNAANRPALDSFRR